jgi:hypothetical protein
MNLGQLIRQLERAKKVWGEETIVGIALQGNDIVMPIHSVKVETARQRVTIKASWGDATGSVLPDISDSRAYVFVNTQADSDVDPEIWRCFATSKKAAIAKYEATQGPLGNAIKVKVKA